MMKIKEELMLEKDYGLSVTLSLTLINEAIDSGWESLLFESNTVFGELKGPGGSIILETTGEVRIINEVTGEDYSNSEIFKNKELMEAIKNNTIEVGDYVIDNNNWFAMVFFDENGSSVDDFVFESTPDSIEGIVNEMKSAYDYFVDEEGSVKENYLVVVLEDFCLDGQVMESDYCLDLMDSEHIDKEDYDKRDFFGEFVLKTVEANTRDFAIKMVANEYNLEPEMLKAYKLA